MRFLPFLTAAALIALPQFTLAQNGTAPINCPQDQTGCDTGKLPDEEVNLPPAGDVQNVFFLLAPVLGAAGLAAIAGGAGNGGATNSTTSTTN